jgi:hypothetical protein
MLISLPPAVGIGANLGAGPALTGLLAVVGFVLSSFWTTASHD